MLGQIFDLVLVLMIFSRPYLVWSRLCYSVASVCRLSPVRNVLWLNGASYSKSYYW